MKLLYKFISTATVSEISVGFWIFIFFFFVPPTYLKLKSVILKVEYASMFYTVSTLYFKDTVTYYMGNGWELLDVQTFFLDRNTGMLILLRELDDAAINNQYTVSTIVFLLPFCYNHLYYEDNFVGDLIHRKANTSFVQVTCTQQAYCRWCHFVLSHNRAQW